MTSVRDMSNYMYISTETLMDLFCIWQHEITKILFDVFGTEYVNKVSDNWSTLSSWYLFNDQE
jgi:hypothetical protein